MSTAHADPVERTNDVPRIVAELQLSVREALAKHRLAGNPVAVWRQGRVCWIPAAEIPVGLDDDSRRGG